MNVDELMSNVGPSRIYNPNAPRRELDISEEDVEIIDEAITMLDRSSLKTEDIYEVFSDWQTKKTLTSKRVFFSTSILVAAAAWIGIDYTELSFFGLKVANGSPERFVVFVLVSILASGMFYEFSRRIDASVRNAKIKNINTDLKDLLIPVEVVDGAMKRNNIEGFVDLYYDFRSSLNSPSHNAIDVYGAVSFYKKNLWRAGVGLNLVTVIEYLAVYLIAAFALFSLIRQFC